MLSREQALSDIEEAGFQWLRQRFPWDLIEVEPGVYDWAPWDEIVEATERHDLELIAVLDGSPEWVRAEADAGNPLAPPLESRDFGTFVRAFAERYGHRVDYYQIWEEPNIAPHWGEREINPAAYGHLLREAGIQLRAADPGSTILLAALAPNVEPGGANMNELRFLEELYQQGSAAWFDVVAAQLYDLEGSLNTPAHPERLNWHRVVLLRDVMERHADETTPVWAVSFGLQPDDPAAVASAVEGARADWFWLGPMMWAAWSPTDVHGQYALSSGEGQLGMAYEALRKLGLAQPVAWPGVYQAYHPSAQYQGNWRVTPPGADIGESGDRLVLPFHGTRLDLCVRRGDYRAFLFVTVDGQPANALPTDRDNRAYVVLYDPLNQMDSVVLARGLADGDHVAEIVAQRGWGQWAIVGWTVSRELDSQQPFGLPQVALVLAFAGGVGLVVYAVRNQREEVRGKLEAVVDRYRALDERVLLVITFGCAVLFYLTAGTLLPSVLALALLGLLLFLNPGMGLPLIALALPFYQLGKPLLGKVFSMVEILTILTAVAWVLNWGVARLFSGSKEEGVPVPSSDLRISGWRVSGDQGPANRTRAPSSEAGTQVGPWESARPLRLSALDWGVLALVLLGAVSLLWAEHVRVAAREFRTVVLESALFYVLLRMMAQDRQRLWQVVDAWLLGGMAIAVVGLLQLVVGENLIAADGVARIRGFYGSPNNLALYLGRLLPLALALFGWLQRGRRRVFYGLAFALISAALVLTYSRGALLLGAPASLLLVTALRGRRALLVTLALLLLSGAILFFLAGPTRMISMLNLEQGTTFFRLQLWQSSWNMILDHPVLGVGLDNFLYHYRTYYVLPTAWEEFDLSHPHNLVLDFWLRLGLLGLVVLFWLLIAFFRRGWQAYRRLPEGRDRLLVLGLMGGMVGAVVHGLVDNAFFLVDLAFAFMLALALVQSLGRPPRVAPTRGLFSATLASRIQNLEGGGLPCES
jgi:O-antigen ligase